MHSHAKIIKKKSKQKNNKITLVANKFNKYNNLLIKASRYIYSIPKNKANAVKIKTNEEQIKAKVSKQKIKCESIKSKQKNQRPKSRKKKFPFNKIKIKSLKFNKSAIKKIIQEL